MKNPLSKKTLAIVLALGVIASVGYFGPSTVLADSDNPVHANLVSKIAQKFNLKETDVQAVFDSVRDERREAMKTAREEKLTKAITDGVITEDQKKLILDNLDKHISKKWFTDNGIDYKKLMPYLKLFGRGRGMHK